MENEVIPWVPLDDIPQSPCGIAVAGEPEFVTVRAAYSQYGGERDLLIDIAAEVYGCFGEISGPAVALAPSYPRIEDPRWPRYLWPLMEIRNSTWLALHRDGLWGPDQAYRHYRIVSEGGSFDALTREPVFARWAAPAPPSPSH